MCEWNKCLSSNYGKTAKPICKGSGLANKHDTTHYLTTTGGYSHCNINFYIFFPSSISAPNNLLYKNLNSKANFFYYIFLSTK